MSLFNYSLNRFDSMVGTGKATRAPVGRCPGEEGEGEGGGECERKGERRAHSDAESEVSTLH